MVVNAICRNCHKAAPSDQFRLHYKLRMMVCPNCFSGKTQTQQAKETANQKAEPPKPAGWDKEDEYLQKVSRARKEQTQSQFTKIAGSQHVKCTCAQCKFTFKYDPYNKVPRTCPYCNIEVPNVKIFNL